VRSPPYPFQLGHPVLEDGVGGVGNTPLGGRVKLKFRELSAECRGVQRHELTSRVVVSFDFVAGDVLDMLGGLVDVCSRWKNPYCYRAVGRVWTLTRVNR